MGEPVGTVVRDGVSLVAWLRANPEARTEGATFVVDAEGALRLAPRRSEHVACAAGGAVQTAGELVFAWDGAGGVAVVEASNLSTGYAPEASSYGALAAALDALGVARPAEWTHAFTFRRCGCGLLVLVKDDVYECPACFAALPLARNV